MFSTKKHLAIIAAAILLASPVLAMESQNYQISEDNLDFGKYQEAYDKFNVKDKEAVKGIASLGTISQKSVSWKTALIIGMIITILLSVYFQKNQRKYLSK